MIPTKLKNAIEQAKQLWQSKRGRCIMCAVGEYPTEDGYHYHGATKHRCGNVETCLLCHGCLPPGEICAGCHRKNMYNYEC